MLKGAVCRSYVKLAMLYESEEWCLKESEMGTLQRTEKSMVRAMCGVQLKDRRRSTNLMFLLGLSETIVGYSVHWYGQVLRREDSHVLRRALDFEVRGSKVGWGLYGKSRLTKSVKIGLRKEDVFC